MRIPPAALAAAVALSGLAAPARAAVTQPNGLTCAFRVVPVGAREVPRSARS